MPTIAEHIARNVLTTLQGITRSKGYEVDAYTYRFKTSSNPPTPVDGAIEISEDGVMLGVRLTGKDEYTANYTLRIMLGQPSDTNTPLDQRINAFTGAIHKALMADYQRGGYAIDTTIGKAMPFPADSNPEGFALPVSVLFHTAADNPYSK